MSDEDNVMSDDLTTDAPLDDELEEEEEDGLADVDDDLISDDAAA